MAEDDSVWLGGTNAVLGRLFHLERTSGELTSWITGITSEPTGLILDENGELWWADLQANLIGRLDPDQNQITRFYVPAAPGTRSQDRSLPAKVSLAGRRASRESAEGTPDHDRHRRGPGSGLPIRATVIWVKWRRRLPSARARR